MNPRLAIASLAFVVFSTGPMFAQSPKDNLVKASKKATASTKSHVPTRVPGRQRLEQSTQTRKVIFLLDDHAVLGAGHAAMLVGDRRGWDYFSFGPHSHGQTNAKNLVHHRFESLGAARASSELRRYTKYLYWTGNTECATEMVRHHALKKWRHASYHLIDRNCFTMVGDSIQAGSFRIDLSNPVPVVAYTLNKKLANGYGAWPVIEP